MSIPAAVTELNKEIATLDKTITLAEKKKARLIGVRDSLLKEDSGSGGAPVVKRKPGRKPGAARKSAAGKKAANAKKTVAVSVRKTAAPKKRVLSAEAKKNIADAQRRRWAAHKAAAKTT